MARGKVVWEVQLLRDFECHYWNIEPTEESGGHGYIDPTESTLKNFRTVRQAKLDFYRFAKQALKPGSWRWVK